MKTKKDELNEYLFWYEEDGKDGWNFTVKAKNHEHAFRKAYNNHGPQVKSMMCQQIIEPEK